jgi:hypothetical protein
VKSFWYSISTTAVRLGSTGTGGSLGAGGMSRRL